MSDLTEDFSTNKVLPRVSKRKGHYQGIDTVRLRHVLKRRWYFPILILLSTLLSAFFFNRYNKPIYTADAVLKLSFSEDAKVIGLDVQQVGRRQRSKNLSGEIEIIKSDVLYEAILHSLDLEVSYFNEGKWLYDEKFGSNNFPFLVHYKKKDTQVIFDRKIRVKLGDDSSLRVQLVGDENSGFVKASFDVPITLNGFTFTIQPNKLEYFSVDDSYVFQINSDKSLMSYLDKNLSVQILNLDANTLKVVFSDANQLKAKRIIEEVVDLYLKQTLQEKQKSNAQTLSYLDKQLDSTRLKLEDIELKMQAVSDGSIFGNTSEGYSLISNQIQENIAQQDLLVHEIELLNQLKSLIESGRDLDSFIPSLDGLENSSLMGSINNLNLSNKEFKKLKESHKSNTLSYKNKEIERNAQVETINGYINQNMRILLDELKVVKVRIKKAQLDLSKLPSQETDMVRLKRYYNLYESFFIFLNQKKVEFETTKAGKVPDFLVLSNPSISPIPVNISPSIVYLVSSVASVILSFLLLAGMFLLENKVLNQKEIERLVDVPLLGVVPTFKNTEMQFSKMQILDFPTSRITESFRNIRSKLDFFGDFNSRLITISSTISGEGKTFITLNLSGIVALSDRRVVVLDCDMRKPKLHLGFGVDNEKGVSDILIGRATLGSCVRKSSIDNLDFITAGSIPPNPSELILSKKFDHLLEELKSEYDVIIFDTPPIGLVTDGIHIMNKSDAQIYVARAEYTTLSMIKDIQEIRDTRGFGNFSIVLNDVPYSEYSYGYSGYSYGYYDEENKVG